MRSIPPNSIEEYTPLMMDYAKGHYRKGDTIFCLRTSLERKVCQVVGSCDQMFIFGDVGERTATIIWANANYFRKGEEICLGVWATITQKALITQTLNRVPSTNNASCSIL